MPTIVIPSGQVGSPATTLVANTEQVFTFGDDVQSVDLISDGTAAVWWTIDNTSATVGGTNAYYVLAVPSVDTRQPRTSGTTVVRVISSGTATVRVQRGD